MLHQFPLAVTDLLLLLQPRPKPLVPMQGRKLARMLHFPRSSVQQGQDDVCEQRPSERLRERSQGRVEWVSEELAFSVLENRGE